ncbi:MAG TPA: SRPBCC domain-containing protein, partial [Nocardioides sp.]|nr:SRPBCC domain-containing protein [Nocardioides sp.]
MELRHQFTVPTSVEETWEQFADVASVAECFPGATVTSVEGDSFQGTCKVKL